MLSSVALSPAFAEESKDFFIQLNVGGGGAVALTSQYHSSDKITRSVGNTAAFGIEAGTQINQYFSSSLSFDYLPNFSNSGDLNYGSTKVGRFTPYVTAGIGYAKNSFKTRGNVHSYNYYSSEASTNNFAYKPESWN